MICLITANSGGLKKSGGGKLKISDFMPAPVDNRNLDEKADDLAAAFAEFVVENPKP